LIEPRVDRLTTPREGGLQRVDLHVGTHATHSVHIASQDRPPATAAEPGDPRRQRIEDALIVAFVDGAQVRVLRSGLSQDVRGRQEVVDECDVAGCARTASLRASIGTTNVRLSAQAISRHVAIARFPLAHATRALPSTTLPRTVVTRLTRGRRQGGDDG
jgi:hypothetical protein